MPWAPSSRSSSSEARLKSASPSPPSWPALARPPSSWPAATPTTVRAAGAGRVETLPFDAVDTDSHDEVLARAAKHAGGDLDAVILAFGLLGDEASDEAGGDGAVRLAQTNYVGTVSAGLAVARTLKAQGHGTL